MRRAGAETLGAGARDPSAPDAGALARLLTRLTVALLGTGMVAALTLPAGAAVAHGHSPTPRDRGRALVFTHLPTPVGPSAVVGADATATTAPPPSTTAPAATTIPPPPEPSRAGGVMAASGAPALSPARAAAAASEPGYGCRAAIEWLTYHAAPGFEFICPAYALGHQAFTCQDVPGVCPDNGRLIVIQDPCPAAYKNEAWNSWVVEGLVSGPYDPFGWCR